MQVNIPSPYMNAKVNEYIDTKFKDYVLVFLDDPTEQSKDIYDDIKSHAEGRRYIAHCYDEVPRVNLFTELQKGGAQDALVMIGPEGDFSIDEVRMAVDAGFISVDLGKSRLRTETAGLAAVMMMQLAKEKLNS